MHRIAAIAVTALAFGHMASASDDKGNFFIMGAPGAMTCGDFVAKKDTGTVSADYGNWFSGYVSALNRTTPNVFNLVENLSMEEFYKGVVELCGQFPAMYIEEVTYNLLVKAHEANAK